ncbi:uncharacterized protein LOC6547682 [Drosophila erecta]|uniref:Uncharacterized protein n=1 Tax=Drosophila erecta TaxID=7220 RepID=B3NNH9_DROER|nr:uncharacterized protein LOC6547682 [Drosophila erecta]EDV56630.1 uncharacterized protein Dere_GG22754 [Drosophila erecta]
MRQMCCTLTANFPCTTKLVSIGQKPPPRSACLTQDHCLWRQRNQVEIEQLAKLLGYKPEEIDGFLFNLSLRNYNDLLKPKGNGWDGCNVPLCYPYVCDRYMAIFDHRGNLRSPIHTRSLDSLLPLLLDYLNGDSPNDRKDKPIYKVYPDEHQGKRRSSIESEKVLGAGKEQNVLQSLASSDWIFQIFGSPRESKSGKKTTSRRKPQSVNGTELESEFELESQKDKKNRRNKTFGRQSVFLNDELALAYDKSYDYAEYLMKTLGRHRFRDSYVGPVGDLRTARTRLLIRDLIARKGMNITEKNLRKALKKIDLEWKGTARADNKRELKTAQEISRLYNAIVQTPSIDSIPWEIIGKVRENYPKVPKASKSPRKYSADQDPLPFHEPFAQKKNRTWPRRHSRRFPRNTNYKLSTTRIKRYINTSMKNQIEPVEDESSIYSTRSERGRLQK